MKKKNNDETYEYTLLIPKDRVGVLIGNKGKIKRLIEKKLDCMLEVYNEEVIIKGNDSFKAWLAQQVVKAIGRGFHPNDALLLEKKGYVFEIINIMEFARNQNDKFRLKGRVIGEDGKTRRHLERETKTRINIYGKTIGIIGESQGVQDVIEAINLLLEGANTSTAYKLLENRAKKRLRKELL